MGRHQGRHDAGRHTTAQEVDHNPVALNKSNPSLSQHRSALSMLSVLRPSRNASTAPTSRRFALRSPRPLVRSAPLLLLVICLLFAQSQAAFVEFSNCLASGIRSSDGLQFVPLYVDSTFDTSNEAHLLNFTIFGNVTGQTYRVARPPPDSPQWNNDSNTVGKIFDQTTVLGETTQSSFISSVAVLSYEPLPARAQPFCQSLRAGTQCPVSPVFNSTPITQADVSSLRAVGFQVPMNSSYRFATLDSQFNIYGAELVSNAPQHVACVAVSITPDLGSSIHGILRYLPVAILAIVGFATVSAAVLSPWGTSNPFKWTSNYGRDEDLLRLVTPGFGDCLQYIQFVFLSGALSLNYPGFFRPVVSSVNWSALMFNESFVSHGNGVPNPVNGVYVTHADYYGFDKWATNDEHERHDYGMTRLRQLTGLSQDEDIWAGTIIWLLVIIAAVIVICQVFFFTRFILRTVAHDTEEDLRSKNWPFTGGMLVRLVCNYFLLPLATVSFFQLVVAEDSDAVVVVFAVIFLVALLAFAGWILRIIFASKPRSRLFDDLPTVLLYGPLYNTYSDEAALFALIPAVVTFFRAIAIGAVQPSGIAQIVILAICEVVLILTLHAFRPFRKQTSMNAYHTFFALTRLVVVLLSVSFVPNLLVDNAIKGWIGYVILLLHAIVLVFGFLLNAIQTLVEVIARFTGAGADETTGAATRGTFVKVFGKRQLTRRRRRPGLRSSLNSDAAMLTDDADALENKSAAYGGRSRSLSASSAILLNQRTPDRLSSHLERAETGSAGHASGENSTYTPLQDAEAGPSNRQEIIRPEQGAAPFYRAPRQRRPTGDLMAPGARSRGSIIGVEGSSAGHVSPESDKRESVGTIGKAITSSPEGKSTPTPAYMRRREGSDPTLLNDPRRTDVDYAVREVDFYYNVRGPRLNDQPTRQLKTGPADPVGPVSSATGWFKTMLGKKSKDQGKGFEVVRSSRAPPERFVDEASPDIEPYQDNPPQTPGEPAVLPGQRTRSNEEDREQARAGVDEPGNEGDQTRDSVPVSPIGSEFDGRDDMDVFQGRPSGVSDIVPSLAPIDAGSSIHVPSRYNSQRTDIVGQQGTTLDREAPLLGPIDAGSSIHMPSRFNSRATTVQRQASSAEQYGSAPRRGDSTTRRPVTPPTGRVPFAAPLSPITASGRNSLGAESALSMDRDLMQPDDDEPVIRNLSGNLSIPAVQDRPSSTGFVNQHRIADRITQGTPELQFNEGHEAEVVDAGSRKSARSSTGLDRSL